MAARLRPHHQEDVRNKIQTTQLVNVLQNHALGKDEKELSPSRLKAIEILLKKRLPDLSATTVDATVSSHEMTREEIDSRLMKLGVVIGK